jgi:hypothetical protein
MSNQINEPDSGDDAKTSLDADEYGSLTIEDEPGTVDPGELAGTANDDDDPVGYEPKFSEADDLED